jgi:hypothetical protein
MFICVPFFFLGFDPFSPSFLSFGKFNLFWVWFFFFLLSGQTHVFSLIYGRTKDFWLTWSGQNESIAKALFG